MNVEAYLEELERVLRDARPVPLSASVMVGRQEVEQALSALREQLPEELRQSRWVLKERDEVIDQAEREADRILTDAQREAERVVSESEIVEQSRREAERILSEAREEAKVLRLEAEDYVDGKLANFEIALQKILRSVENGRERLRGRLATDELAENHPDTPAAEGHTDLYDHESDN